MNTCGHKQRMILNVGGLKTCHKIWQLNYPWFMCSISPYWCQAIDLKILKMVIILINTCSLEQLAWLESSTKISHLWHQELPVPSSGPISTLPLLQPPGEATSTLCTREAVVESRKASYVWPLVNCEKCQSIQSWTYNRLSFFSLSLNHLYIYICTPSRSPSILGCIHYRWMLKILRGAQ